MNYYLIFLFLFFLLLFSLCIINKNNIENFIPYEENSVTIVGTARNIDKYLDKIIEKIEMISSLFKKSNIVIYENDSNDKTINILINWKNNSKLNIRIISEKNIPGKRTHRLSYARNKLLNIALELNNYYLVVMDLDNVNLLLTKKYFLSSFNYKNDWACLCANQKDKYYDLWALRTKDDWLNFDCWECVNKKKNVNFCVNSRYKNLPKQKELIEVNSCFGGLAIYKIKYLKDCKYYGGTNNDEVCEHVNLNNDIRLKNNGKIYINTNMINS
jgi:hypothetical protein